MLEKIEKIKTNGNVILVEPNSVNINNEIVNGIPQYQDMHIFAELTAKSKGRTVIIGDNTNTTDSKKVNFIGNNQNDDNNPNYLNFTTNYYDGSNEGSDYYEGFGINNIKIITNSSFIPQIDIQFIDIRGLAFFNQNDSPYRMLFDFPPPIFSLTVKGYYGKAITYKIHLVSYTSEFSSENGNFIIDAKFVAMTFAPLTDVLFRYIVNVPLIKNDKSLSPSTTETPLNTSNLIMKLKNLYTEISDTVDTSEESKRLDNVNDDIIKINENIDIINNFNNNETLKEGGTPYLVIRKPPKDVYPARNFGIVSHDELISIKDLIEFDEIIKNEQTSGIKTRLRNTLYILYLVGTNVPVSDVEEEIEPIYDKLNFEYVSENNSTFEVPLSKFSELLNNNLTINIDDNDIGEPKSFISNIDFTMSNITNTKYYGIDIGTYYLKLYNKKGELEKLQKQLTIDITKKINDLTLEKLGMTLSIYNVFNVILNDVDTFFNKIRTTSDDAWNSHNEEENKKIIIGDESYAEKKNMEIFSFPLVVDTLTGREERVAPINLSKKVDFPELKLVDDFITTFATQGDTEKQYNTRDNQTDDGVHDWIPISPFDSTLGGASPESPYLNINNAIRNDTLKILLKRFYMLTQGSIPDAFYTKPSGSKRLNKENIVISDKYSTLYSEAEAINLASTLTSDLNININTIKVMVLDYNKSIDNFYSEIEDIKDFYYNGTELVNGNLYDFPTNDPKYFPVTPNNITEGRVYLDKTNLNFEGINLTSDTIEIRQIDENSTNPIDNFGSDIKTNLFRKNPAEDYFDFTKENIIYITDRTSKKNVVNDGGEMSTYTRYLTSRSYYSPAYYVTNIGYGGVREEKESWDTKFPGEVYKGTDDTARQMIAYNEGNNSFEYVGNIDRKNQEYVLSLGNDITKVWSTMLGSHDNDIIDTLTGSTRLSSLLVLSNFGYTLSPFNVYPNVLNSIVFDIPAAVEVPAYYAPYLGALVDAIDNDWVDDIIDYFTGDTGGAVLNNRGFYILADLHDIEHHLAEQDKRELKIAYNTYMGNYDSVVTGIKKLYNYVHSNDLDLSIEEYKTRLYRFYLDPNKKEDRFFKKISKGKVGQSFYLIRRHIVRTTLINYSQITFNMSDDTKIGYTSLKTLNDTEGDIDFKKINDDFFINLFSKLGNLIIDIEDKIKKEKKELEKVRGDKDIINQLYYSFKNINDKWLTGTPKTIRHYPFNVGNKRLIDLFAFVDRGMNPIGETIINAEILIDMLDNPNLSVFSVLTQLLSLNGFEFFPIQNFMRFDKENSWYDSFEIQNSIIDDSQNTFFVCMYIGGSASYPSTSSNGFENDGIIDISAPNVKGFEKNDAGSNYEENQKQGKNKDFPWQEVRAFRVRFGEQNQSMFTNMKIDSKEYPETNESIQILSRLAGDNSTQAKVPKGQNLYNLYENRSYKATITGLGNVMIQPTQYFQLENIPLFNGAYIILDVEHNITANKMTTSFSGTKLLKFPVPRVLNQTVENPFISKTPGEMARDAGILGKQADGMRQDTLDRLKGELGVDVSHWNGNVNWKAAKKAGIKFAFIKLTEGETWFDNRDPDYDVVKNVRDAFDNDILTSYYHFARFGRTSNPETDGINDATNFLTHLADFPKPDLPVVLDIEWQSFPEETPYEWSNKRSDINTFITAFLDTMDDAKYDTMIYTNKNFMKDYGIGLNEFGRYPLWIANYMNIPITNPETDEPTLPKEWHRWATWQFTSRGIVDGISANIKEGGVDLNVMKTNFLNKKYNRGV